MQLSFADLHHLIRSAKLEAESMQRPMKPAPTKDHRENNCAQTNQNYPFSALDVSEKEGE